MTLKVLSRILMTTAAVAVLAGCSSDLGFSKSTPTVSPIVVGDEPYAVKAAAQIMAQGGNAVDAVTTMYFALSVTYPVAAGLGGGGICIVHDPVRNRDEEFDFLARNAAGGGAFAVPGNVRGFAALHAVYGSLPWQRVIAPSEGYASTGFPISQALATRLKTAENVIRLDAGLAAEFMDETGQVKPAGSIVYARDLSDTLAAIRTGGVESFYSGSVADAVVSYSSTQGGAMTSAELAAYPVARGAPHQIVFGGERVFVPGQGTGAGAFAGRLFEGLVQMPGATNIDANTEAAVVAASKQTLSDFGVVNLPGDLGSTGFAATDGSGRAAACAVTMNGPFGSGHTAQGTGITLAKAPATTQSGLASAFLTPVVAMDSGGQVVLTGAGAGGPIGTASIADAIARLAKGEVVTRRGKADVDAASYDTVNAILCQDGICSALLDASANGLGASPGR